MPWGNVRSLLANTQFDGSGGVTTAGTLGGAVAVGDTILLVSTVGQDPAPLSPTVTDQLSNTYVRKGSVYDSINGQGFDYWVCIVTNAGTPTITYRPNGATGAAWIAFKADHVTGSDGSSTVRAAGPGAFQSHPGTTADAVSSGSIAAQTGDLLWGACGVQSPDTTLAIGTGFSATTAIDATTGILTEYKTASGAGAATFTDATNGNAKEYSTFAIAITPAGGGGGGGGSAPRPVARLVGGRQRHRPSMPSRRHVMLPPPLPRGSLIASGTGQSLSASRASVSGAVSAAGTGTALSPSSAIAAGASIALGTGTTTSQSLSAGRGIWATPPRASTYVLGDRRPAPVRRRSHVLFLNAVVSGSASSTIATGTGFALSVTRAVAAGAASALGSGRALSATAARGAGSLTASGTGVALSTSVAPGSSSSVVTAVGSGASLGISVARADGAATSGGAGQSVALSLARAAGAVIAAASGISVSAGAVAAAAAAVALGTGISIAISCIRGTPDSGVDITLGSRPLRVRPRSLSTSVRPR